VAYDGAMPDQNHQSIRDTIWIAAPVPRVFLALTSGQELQQWWPKQAQTEPRLGGAIELHWFAPSSQRMLSRFAIFEANVQLGYAFYSQHLHFRLGEQAAGTKLEIDHACEAAEALHVAQSWGFLKANLKAWMEHGIDLRVR